MRAAQQLMMSSGASGAAGRHAQLQRKCACGGSAGLTGECEDCQPKRLLGLQTKLSVGRAGDGFEAEADRLAEQVVSADDASAPKSASHLQGHRTASVAPSDSFAGDAPPIVHEVIGSAGRPLESSTRAFMESRFGHDFSQVRVHADAQAATSARAVDALAYTSGRHVVLGAGLYEPETVRGRRLLAHELTHVIQQESARARNGAAGQAEPQAVLQRQSRSAATASTQNVDTTLFNCGDIVLDANARVDVVDKDAFFSDPDRKHLKADASGRLCYEKNYDHPADRFRWQHLKEIVAGGHVEIRKIGMRDKFNARKMRGQTSTTEERTLAGLGTTGVMLERPSVAQKTYPAAQESGSLSTKDDRDQIYYADAQSLAHEFFGHVWLATKNVPYRHPITVEDEEEAKKRKLSPDEVKDVEERMKKFGTLEQTHDVKDPFGRVYTGRVFGYINHYSSGVGSKSPTKGVGGVELLEAINVIRDAGANHTLKKGKPVPKDVADAWKSLDANYESLRDNPEADKQQQAAPTAAASGSGAKQTHRPTVTSQWVEKAILDIVQKEFNQEERDVFVDFLKTAGTHLSHGICFSITGTPC